MDTPIRRLDDDLFAVEGLFRAAGGVRFPVRSTIVRGAEGLTIVAPIAFDDATRAAIDALGPVTRIVAPNRFHWASYAAARQAWPTARGYGAPGLAEKRPELRFDETLAAGRLGALEVFAIEGAPAASEHVFAHVASGTLIVTDLVFAIRRAENFRSWLVFKLVARTLGHVRASRLWGVFRKDPAAFEQSVARVLEVEFERLVVAHGDVVEEDGRRVLEEGLAWLRPGRALVVAGA
ncbi:MAG: hypothetical protein KC731_06200 [Myxococcales bacterium]|nr:hypothetical protein [Myxococcales bacterium]